MQPTAGEVIILGYSPRDARSSVGYLTQVFSLYHDLSVAENLRYMGELRRLPLQEIERRSERYLEMFGLARFKNRLAGKLSGGMKQKLSLACALIIEPKVLLLDEPTTGVDPVSRREFWDVLADLSHQGITIVVAHRTSTKPNVAARGADVQGRIIGRAPVGCATVSGSSG
jgi:ABC-2 type transport system ATP-binding protein